MQDYNRNSEKTTQHTDKEHKRVMGQKVLTKLYREEIAEAIAHTNRAKKDVDGRQRKIGWVVAKLCAKLWEWEGKSELDDAWVHKANERFSRELKITPKQLRRAKELAVGEGLVEHKVGLRPSDWRQTSFYRLNLWRVAQMVVEQELADIKWELDNHTFEGDARRKKRERMVNRCHTLEQAKSDLSLIDTPDSPIQQGNPTMPKGHTYPDQKAPLQGKQQGNKETVPLGGTAKKDELSLTPPSKKRRKESNPTPPEGIEALKRSDDRFVRSRWELGLEWDFTQEQRPPIQMFLSLGNSEDERWKYFKRMKRIVREAVSAERDPDLDDDPLSGGHTERRRDGTVLEYDANGTLVSRTSPSGYVTQHNQRKEHFK